MLFLSKIVTRGRRDFKKRKGSAEKGSLLTDRNKEKGGGRRRKEKGGVERKVEFGPKRLGNKERETRNSPREKKVIRGKGRPPRKRQQSFPQGKGAVVS